MDLYDYVCKHPNNNLVQHHAFAGFVCEIRLPTTAQVVLKKGRPTTTLRYKLEGITEALSKFTGNYDHKYRVLTNRRKKQDSPAQKVRRPDSSSSSSSSTKFAKPKGRFGGMVLGRRIHGETQLVTRLMQTIPDIPPVADSSKDRVPVVDLRPSGDKGVVVVDSDEEEKEEEGMKPSERSGFYKDDDDEEDDGGEQLRRQTDYAQRRAAQLAQTFRLASHMKTQNGATVAISPFTECLVRSMVNVWNWKLMEAEWVVGDVSTRPALKIGRHATPIDFVAINRNTNRLILGETKSSYNHGSFYREQGRMTRSFSCFDNSPLTLAKLQLVMGALMFTRQFDLETRILTDGMIELWVVHLPTVEGETVAAKRVSKRFIILAEAALIAEGLLRKPESKQDESI